MSRYTPWGSAQTQKTLADGIASYTTSSHGGIHLSPERNAQIPDYIRNKDGWYEEDIEWAIVVFFTPDVPYTQETRNSAADTMRHWFPDAYEAATGEKLTPETSMILRERKFYQDNQDNYISVSAFGDWYEKVPSGFVGVQAVLGKDFNPNLFFVQKSFFGAH